MESIQNAAQDAKEYIQDTFSGKSKTEQAKDDMSSAADNLGDAAHDKAKDAKHSVQDAGKNARKNVADGLGKAEDAVRN